MPGFVTEAGAARLPDLPRYLQAMVVRLDRLADDPSRRDRGVSRRSWRAYDEYARALPPSGREACPRCSTCAG